jgi:hypothetical protein
MKYNRWLHVHSALQLTIGAVEWELFWDLVIQQLQRQFVLSHP